MILSLRRWSWIVKMYICNKKHVFITFPYTVFYAKVGRFFICLWNTKVFLTPTAVYQYCVYFRTNIDLMFYIYSVAQANLDSGKNMLLLKNPQFLPNYYETLSKWSTLEYLILTKFHNDWVKIVDFLIKAYFWFTVHFFAPHLNYDLVCLITWD